MMGNGAPPQRPWLNLVGKLVAAKVSYDLISLSQGLNYSRTSAAVSFLLAIVVHDLRGWASELAFRPRRWVMV